jgi:hypothetical protein
MFLNCEKFAKTKKREKIKNFSRWGKTKWWWKKRGEGVYIHALIGSKISPPIEKINIYILMRQSKKKQKKNFFFFKNKQYKKGGKETPQKIFATSSQNFVLKKTKNNYAFREKTKN